MATAVFSGLASGIDSASLIDSVIQAREKQNESRKAEIDLLESGKESLEELNTKILALNDLIERFRTVNGGGVSKKTSSSDSTVATAVASTAANNATLNLNVTSVASAATASFNDAYALTSDPLAANAVGTQTISVDVGTGSNLVTVSVDITSSTTVQQFVDAFNADSNTLGRVSASVVNVGTTSTPSYRVVFNTLKEGTDNGTIAFNIPTAGAGFGGNADLQNRTTQQATNAQFTLSGVSGTITRSSNSVTDVVPGVTLNLAKTGTAVISVTDDADSTVDSFQEIIDGYNDIVEFIAENNKVTTSIEGGQTKITYGSLAKIRADDDFLARFRTTFAGVSADSGLAVTAFSELGVSTNRDGTLTLDPEKFKTAVGSDPIGAAEVLRDFADTSSGISGFIYEFTKFQGLIDISETSLDGQIKSLNEKIEQVERGSEQIRATLLQKFSRLETVTARLQQQQQQLTSVLAGLQ